MPAYNAEAYLPATLDSILAQTYGRFELTVVDDGSSDATLSILEEYSGRDSRIQILHTDNGGPANARNFALDSLDGSADFVMFCDADDLLDKDMLQTVVEQALDGADFVITGFAIVNADGSEHYYCEPDVKLDPDTLGVMLGRLYKANLLNQVWGKLFRSDIIYENTIRFPDYRWGEDRFFVFDYLSHSYNVTVLSYCGYKYMMHEGQSLITSFFPNKADICVLIDERIEELCRKYGVEDDEPFRYMFAKSIFSCMSNLFSPTCKLNIKQKREYIWSIINDRYVLERCKGAEGSTAIKLLCKLMASGSITVNMTAARFTAIFSKLFPDTFRRIKHKK